MKKYLLMTGLVMLAVGASWLLPGATGRGIGRIAAQQPATQDTATVSAAPVAPVPAPPPPPIPITTRLTVDVETLNAKAMAVWLCPPSWKASAMF